MMMRPMTNCNFLFLNKNMVTNAKIDDAKNIVGMDLKDHSFSKNKSTTKISPF